MSGPSGTSDESPAEAALRAAKAELGGYGMARGVEISPSGVVSIDVDGVLDAKKNVEYLGRATRGENGMWRALAKVDGCLCVVEAKISFKGFEMVDDPQSPFRPQSKPSVMAAATPAPVPTPAPEPAPASTAVEASSGSKMDPPMRRKPFSDVALSSLPDCDKEVLSTGVQLVVLHTLPKEYIEAWVRRLAALLGRRTDWHWVGGRAVVRAIVNRVGGPTGGEVEPSEHELVASCLDVMMPEYDALLAAMQKARRSWAPEDA